MKYITTDDNINNTVTSSNVSSNVGKILIALTGGVAIGLTIIAAPFISPALRKYCLPYIPATTQQVDNILIALSKCKKGTLIDLGSGDGRIVIEAAKHGYKADGVELNPWLVIFSKLNSLWHGTSKQTRFYCTDLWKFSLRKYDNIVIFGVEQMMSDLEKKLLEESTERECNIIACRFPLPGTVPSYTIGHGVDTVWLYSLKKINQHTHM